LARILNQLRLGGIIDDVTRVGAPVGSECAPMRLSNLIAELEALFLEEYSSHD
jgi:hypothetical protein